MSTQAKTNEDKKGKGASSVVWFEIPADNVERAKKFYSALLGWKIEKFPGVPDYWHVDTGGDDRTRDGGLIRVSTPINRLPTISR